MMEGTREWPPPAAWTPAAAAVTVTCGVRAAAAAAAAAAEVTSKCRLGMATIGGVLDAAQKNKTKLKLLDPWLSKGIRVDCKCIFVKSPLSYKFDNESKPSTELIVPRFSTSVMRPVIDLLDLLEDF